MMEWPEHMEDENVTDFANEVTSDGLDSSQNSNQYTFVVLGWFLVVCGIFENVFICWILICKERKCFKSFSNFHLLNLAITDILFRAVSIPDLLQGELIGGSNLTCKIIDFGKFTTLAVTFAILAGIAFDRYIHIVHPFRARTVTWKHSRNVIALSWIWGVICSAPFLHSTEWEVEVDEETLEKFRNCVDKHGLPFEISVTVFLVGSFIIPLVFMGFVYSRIVIVLWSRARYKVISKNVAKTKIRAVKMMVLIVLTYVITWGPKLILETMEAFDFEEISSEGSEEEEGSGGDSGLDTLSILEAVFQTLSLASSVLNPLIFGYYNGSFREELKNIFYGRKDANCSRKRRQKVFPLSIKSHVSTAWE